MTDGYVPINQINPGWTVRDLVGTEFVVQSRLEKGVRVLQGEYLTVLSLDTLVERVSKPPVIIEVGDIVRVLAPAKRAGLTGLVVRKAWKVGVLAVGSNTVHNVEPDFLLKLDGWKLAAPEGTDRT